MRIGDYTRNIVLLGWAVILLIFAAGLQAGVLFVNYFSAEQSFELLGFEPRKVASDPLLGPVFELFWSDATMAHLWAAALAIGVALGIFSVAHFASRTLHLGLEWRQAASAGDGNQAKVVLEYLVFETLLCALFLIPLMPVLFWDMDLFRYRWAAQLLGIEEPAQAVAHVGVWPDAILQHKGLMAWSVGALGPWAYLGVTACFAFFLELRGRKLSEAWARVWSALDEPPAVPTPPANDPIPEPHPEQPADLRPQPERPQMPAGGDRPASDSREPLHEVIGGPRGQRITITEALADPQRYWVDPDTRQIWNAAFRQDLNSQEMLNEA